MDWGDIFGPKTITKEMVAALHELSPRRISFATTHASQPRRSSPPSAGTFNIPFGETIRRIFEKDTDLDLYQNQKFPGYWRSIKTEEEFKNISDWKCRQGTRIFIRDHLDLSIALDFNLVDNHGGGYTPLGALESRAKDHPDEEAIEQLVAHYVAAIGDLPGYRDAQFVAAVPAGPDKVYDLPRALASRIAAALGRQDVTDRFSFTNHKGTIKQLSFDQKWDAWEAVDLTFVPALPVGASIILIDDKYQSGMTIQFVASKLYEAGANEVYGLCAVKTLRDTDNQ